MRRMPRGGDVEMDDAGDVHADSSSEEDSEHEEDDE